MQGYFCSSSANMSNAAKTCETTAPDHSLSSSKRSCEAGSMPHKNGLIKAIVNMEKVIIYTSLILSPLRRRMLLSSTEEEPAPEDKAACHYGQRENKGLGGLKRIGYHCYSSEEDLCKAQCEPQIGHRFFHSQPPTRLGWGRLQYTCQRTLGR